MVLFKDNTILMAGRAGEIPDEPTIKVSAPFILVRYEARRSNGFKAQMLAPAATGAGQTSLFKNEVVIR